MILVIAMLLAFGVFHSLTAAIGVKAIFLTVLGERAYLGLYRLFYNTVSVVTFVPVLVVTWLADKTIWSLEGLPALMFMALQGIGVLGLVVSLLQIDLMRFLGLRQAAVYAAGEPLPLPPEPLTENGVYALVRHPLYFFSLLFLWFMPTMTEGMFGLTLASTVYFLVGSLLEERKMIHFFGEQYIAYRRRVPWMIPFLKLK